jgi:hypothetical protein
VRYTLRKTLGPLAAGTALELVDVDGEGFDKIAKKRHGYVTVRMPLMSRKLRDQNHPLIRQMVAANGTFDIETDNLVKMRDRG